MKVLKGRFTLITKKHISHLPLVVCSHAEVSVKVLRHPSLHPVIIFVKLNLVFGADSIAELHYKKFNGIVSLKESVPLLLWTIINSLTWKYFLLQK